MTLEAVLWVAVVALGLGVARLTFAFYDWRARHAELSTMLAASRRRVAVLEAENAKLEALEGAAVVNEILGAQNRTAERLERRPNRATRRRARR